MDPDIIIKMAEELCDKFISKVESNKARSVETYADCKKLKAWIKKYRTIEANKERLADGS